MNGVDDRVAAVPRRHLIPGRSPVCGCFFVIVLRPSVEPQNRRRVIIRAHVLQRRKRGIQIRPCDAVIRRLVDTAVRPAVEDRPVVSQEVDVGMGEVRGTPGGPVGPLRQRASARR